MAQNDGEGDFIMCCHVILTVVDRHGRLKGQNVAGCKITILKRNEKRNVKIEDDGRWLQTWVRGK